MSDYKAKYWSILTGTLVLWAAVGGVLIYNHNVLLAERLTPAALSQKEMPLLVIAGLFVVFNAVMSFLRLLQLRRNRPPADMERP